MTESDTDQRPGDRIAKVLARAGVCSRREAERLIAAGRVTVNGTTLKTPATLVAPDDDITVDGERVKKPDAPRLWRYHKPTGLVTTHADEKGRTTVFDTLPPYIPRVVSIGRLDLNSEGLLLLTNAGELAHLLEHPSKGWVRRYRARVHGTVSQAGLDRLQKGVTVDGISYGSIEAAIEDQRGDKQTAANTWVTVALKEGKNREVRKALDHIGLKVNRLIRTAYGPFQLGRLRPGDIEEIPGKVLKEQLGREAAQELGL